ncbi:MAG: methionine--tRNA ligase [Candidatus Jorgensenbacteria bacterium]
MISIDDFKNIELKVGKVLTAARVEGSDKLVRISVDLGPSTGSGQAKNDIRQLVAGIGKAYEPEALIGKEITVVANLEPRQLMGLESQGMLLAASDENGPVLLVPERPVPPGAQVK